MRLAMRIARTLSLLGLLLVVSALAGAAAGWTPAAWTQEDTLDLLTVGPEEGEYWFPVWLVVLDDQVYVRLGSRATDRVQKNRTAPYLGVRIAGQQFDRVKATPAPDMVERVAAAMGEKYWSDVFIRHMDHPLTLRLEPEAAGN